MAHWDLAIKGKTLALENRGKFSKMIDDDICFIVLLGDYSRLHLVTGHVAGEDVRAQVVAKVQSSGTGNNKNSKFSH